MLTVLLALAVAQTPTHRLFKQPNLPTSSLAFFEAFPSSGAGTTTACSTTPPTGARGEVLTFTRTGNGTCTKTATGGLATTGIADGDLVVLSGNVARVEYDSNGTLGLLIESARTNSLPRYNDLTNAAWSDVGTPTVTDGATDPFGGTSGDTITDNDAAAYEGRAQTISVSAGTAYFGHCFVKAGTATTARITVDGTAGTITGLSASTWSIIEVADASASSASIVVQVMVGNATTVTGTVVFGGCQVEAGTYRTSIIPTVAAAVVRNAESVPSFTLASTVAAGSSGGFALSIWPLAAPTTGTWLSAPAGSANPDMMGRFSGATTSCYARTTGVDLTAAGAWSTTASNRLVCTTERLTRLNATDGTLASTTLFAGFSNIALGNGTFGAMVDGIYSRICFDTNASRCR